MYIIIRVFVCLCTLLSQQLFADDLKQVTLQASWFEQFQSAGYYIAQEKGFYKNVGLDVTIKDYKLGVDAVHQINDGEIDFAVGSENLILAKANNKNAFAQIVSMTRGHKFEYPCPVLSDGCGSMAHVKIMASRPWLPK